SSLLNARRTADWRCAVIYAAIGNQLYADNPGGWYQWTGSGWSGTSNPTPASPPPPPPPPPGVSPDGTILLPGSAGSLVTSAGTWTGSASCRDSGQATVLEGQSK